MNETNWTAKIPEKVRCVFHFADKEDDTGKLVGWESFKASQVRSSAVYVNLFVTSAIECRDATRLGMEQEAELEELDRIVAVYAKGHYDERCVRASCWRRMVEPCRSAQ